MDLNKLTLADAHDGLVDKKFSSTELTKACYDKIAKSDTDLHAFLLCKGLKDDFLRQAASVDQKISEGTRIGYLEGIPYALKDNIVTKGIRTTAGSNMLSNYIPPYSATVVNKLNEAGAILLGKLNMDAFAHGSSTENSDFGPTKNPFNHDKIPGGSSGGSAAATAANEAIFTLGSETAGSIREPASFCGVTGLKPTYGRVSRYGLIAMGSSLDCIGSLTKSALDAAMVLETIAGIDKRDATSIQLPVPEYSRIVFEKMKGKKIGVPKEYFLDLMDPEVKDSVKQAISKFEEMGAIVTEISLPLTKYAAPTYAIISSAEISSNLARFDGIRFGHSATKNDKIDIKDLEEYYLESRTNGFNAENKRRIMLGSFTLSSGYYDEYYLKASKVRTKIIEEFENAFEEVDLIVGPVTGDVAGSFGVCASDPLFCYLSDEVISPSTLAGLPGVSIPCGFKTPKGEKQELPIGFQIIGPHFAEDEILSAATAYQQVTVHHRKIEKL